MVLRTYARKKPYNDWMQPIAGKPCSGWSCCYHKKIGYRKTCDKVLIGSFWGDGGIGKLVTGRCLGSAGGNKSDEVPFCEMQYSRFKR